MTHKPTLHVHTSRIAIRWSDLDALGHVNNTVYFRYMEQARIDWTMSLPGRAGAAALPIVIVNASCTFLRPLFYPGEVEVRMLLSEPGRTSVVSHYEIRCEGERCAEGAAKIVFVNRDTGRPAPLPEAVGGLFAAATATAAD